MPALLNCPACGYDLRVAPRGVCPECGLPYDEFTIVYRNRTQVVWLIGGFLFALIFFQYFDGLHLRARHGHAIEGEFWGGLVSACAAAIFWFYRWQIRRSTRIAVTPEGIQVYCNGRRRLHGWLTFDRASVGVRGVRLRRNGRWRTVGGDGVIDDPWKRREFIEAVEAARGRYAGGTTLQPEQPEFQN